MITRIAIATGAALLSFGMTACGSADTNASGPVTSIDLGDSESIEAMHSAVMGACGDEKDIDAYTDCRDELLKQATITMSGTVLNITALPDEYQVIVVGNDTTHGEVFVCPDMVDGCKDIKMDDTVSLTAEYTLLRPDAVLSVVVRSIE
jgi:hypothetical protein